MKRPIFLILCLGIVAVTAWNSAAASGRQARVLRQYPIASALEVPPVTTIGLTASAAYDNAALGEDASITIWGSRSGSHHVRTHLSDDARTLILEPITAFEYNETVSVSVQAPLRSGQVLIDAFTFKTMIRPVSTQPLLQKMSDWNAITQLTDTSEVVPDTLPPINITLDAGGTVGTYYFANFGLNQAPNHNFLFNLDQHGAVVRAENKYHTNALDFKTHQDGRITYFDAKPWKFVEVDSTWHPIDTFGSVNGYQIDEHELRFLPNGGYAILAISGTTLDSSQYQPGMVPNATIGGDVIQIFDAHRNLVFEWRGIDHYRVADAIHEKLGDSSIDFEHANSLEFDSAGNIIISNRHLSEISKISASTGEFMWRMGGRRNEFTLVGDSIWYSYQHCARLLPNGHMTLFDNADYDSVTGVAVDPVGQYIRHSRAMELEIDTATRIARVVWQWHHSPETFSVAMGSVQRLRNGHTIIGWGLNFNTAITEVGRNDETLFEMNLGPQNVSYRAFLDPVDSLMTVRPKPASRNELDARFVTTGIDGAVTFTVTSAQSVTLHIFDILGREVLAPLSEFVLEGERSIPVATKTLVPGTYFCTLQTGSGMTATVPFVVTQ